MMAELSWQEDLLSFLNELPEELLGSDKSLRGTVISLDDIFQTGLLMMPGAPDPNPLMPVQVEDSTLPLQSSEETVSREKKIIMPGFVTKSSDDRTNARIRNASSLRKRTADNMLLDSDSDSAESSCSGSEEKSVEFAEQFLAFGIRCKPFFWQYNQESRGPKAKRLLLALDEGDFHVLSDCIDPVFNSMQNVVSYSHDEVRRGRGSDLRPDPFKLLNIGSRISGMQERCKSTDGKVSGKQVEVIGREKSKLASRICRLRKKAHHEANKIKLEGLEKEQSQLIHVSVSMLKVMHERIMKSAVQPNADHSTTTFCVLLKALISKHLGFMVAGHTVEFVNRELETAAKQLLAGGKARNGPGSDGEG